MNYECTYNNYFQVNDGNQLEQVTLSYIEKIIMAIDSSKDPTKSTLGPVFLIILLLKLSFIFWVVIIN